MSIQTAPAYWLVCDSCGARCPAETDEYVTWGDQDQAIDHAVDRDWSISPDRARHHCPRCEPLCTSCGSSAGPEAGERDYQCPGCWQAQDESVAAQVVRHQSSCGECLAALPCSYGESLRFQLRLKTQEWLNQ